MQKWNLPSAKANGLTSSWQPKNFGGSCAKIKIIPNSGGLSFRNGQSVRILR